ncbi:dynein axonemal assembly factor 4 isoform X2 [Astatotilapia calliptera]|uniref:dynein axonemal assembly factor 4 isoform X2 n=1 Tax=Astatotilapia calliptera TaxID=8154 RepID=UPI000E40137F|nr:dynein assembly factor 4, axonemal isoform X2 [Astatotilapia calliptera]
MPLVVMDYVWTQTETTLYINVPLKGTNAGKVDIVCTDDYLKVHFPPYLFEAFLFEPVDDDRIAVRVANGCAVITLPKRTNKVWKHLMISTDQRSNSNAKSKKAQHELPPPRLSGNIQVTFTPRIFPTALRESRLPEEEEWLRKQAETRRKVNVDVGELEDLKEEERNPYWLKDKGDKCFATGDFLGAVNAYSLAIRVMGKIPALHSNRAACHLKLRNFHKAIEDSSQALDLLTPPVPANAAARVRAFVRRGSAFCELQAYPEGLQDFLAALKIDPNNEALLVDTQRIRDIIQGSAVNPPSETE